MCRSALRHAHRLEQRLRHPQQPRPLQRPPQLARHRRHQGTGGSSLACACKFRQLLHLHQRKQLRARRIRKGTHWNLSTQSMPFGSSFEYTKQLNAALNSSPHGPCAMPPRHGQSQLISPVSGLNAPCCPASSSSCSGVLSTSPSATAAVVVFAISPVDSGGVGCVEAFAAAVWSWPLALMRASSSLRFPSTTASTVGRSFSENCGGSVE